MSSRIEILPDHVVNRIAAGEVVERPASVVKELVENALDAEALEIEVELMAGGRSLIRVSDDGTGMDEDEALLALERHATSKLREASDLDRISTLGFRGEALPSIAAVSRLRMTTCPDPSRGGVSISVEGGKILGVEGCARKQGSTFEIRDLFFNTPARRKFLHAPETELRHAQEALTAIAMARPEVGIRLKHGNRVLIEALSTHDLEQRFRDVLRRRKPGKIRRFEAEGGGYRIWGLVAEASGSGRPRISLLVNGRWVRDRLMVAAVYRVLRGAGQGFGGAQIVLALSAPPDAVDVNVHPAKAEVRFARSGAVFALIERALRRLLEATHGSVPVRSLESAWGSGSSAAMSKPAFPMPDEPSSTAPMKESQPSIFSHPLYGSVSGGAVQAGVEESSRWELRRPSAHTGARARMADTPFGRLLAQYRDSFLLLEDDDGLLIVDQHVAHERVLYERILKRLSSESPPSQGLLEPVLLEMDEARAGALDRIQPLLASAGLEVDSFGPETLRLSALPPELNGEDAGAFVEEMLDKATDLDGTPERVADKLREETAASLSCRAAIKVNHSLKDAEQRVLLDDLAKTSDPYRCPHGRPIILRLGQDEMERRLGRR